MKKFLSFCVVLLLCGQTVLAAMWQHRERRSLTEKQDGYCGGKTRKVPWKWQAPQKL